MTTTIHTIPLFDRELKKLRKRYAGIVDDFDLLLNELLQNPYLGDIIPNTEGGRKIRMAITAKKKGKREGARVITYTVELTENGSYDVWLLFIYDKSEYTDIKPAIVKEMIAELLLEEAENEKKEE